MAYCQYLILSESFFNLSFPLKTLFEVIDIDILDFRPFLKSCYCMET